MSNTDTDLVIYNCSNAPVVPVSSSADSAITMQPVKVSNSQEIFTRPNDNLNLANISTTVDINTVANQALQLFTSASDTIIRNVATFEHQSLMPVNQPDLTLVNRVNNIEQNDNIFQELMKKEDDPRVHLSDQLKKFDLENAADSPACEIIDPVDQHTKLGEDLYHNLLHSMGKSSGQLNINKKVINECLTIAKTLRVNNKAKKAFFSAILHTDDLPAASITRLISVTSFHICFPPPELLGALAVKMLQFSPSTDSHETETYDVRSTAAWLSVLFRPLINNPNAIEDEYQKQSRLAIQYILNEVKSHLISCRPLIMETKKIIYNALYREDFLSERVTSLCRDLATQMEIFFEGFKTLPLYYHESLRELYALRFFENPDSVANMIKYRNNEKSFIYEMETNGQTEPISTIDNRIFLIVFNELAIFPFSWTTSAFERFRALITELGDSGNLTDATLYLINLANENHTTLVSKQIFDKLFERNIKKNKDNALAILFSFPFQGGNNLTSKYLADTAEVALEMAVNWKEYHLTGHLSERWAPTDKHGKRIPGTLNYADKFNFLEDYLFNSDKVPALLSAVLEEFYSFETEKKAQVIDKIIARNYNADTIEVQLSIRKLNQRLQNLIPDRSIDDPLKNLQHQALVDSAATIQLKLLILNRIKNTSELVDNLATNLARIDITARLTPQIIALSESFNNKLISDSDYIKIITGTLEKINVREQGISENIRQSLLINSAIDAMKRRNNLDQLLSALMNGAFTQSLDKQGISKLSKLIHNEILPPQPQLLPLQDAKDRQALSRFIISDYKHWQLLVQIVDKIKKGTDLSTIITPETYLIAEKNVRRPMINLLNQQQPHLLGDFIQQSLSVIAASTEKKAAVSIYPAAEIYALNSLCKFIGQNLQCRFSEVTIKSIYDLYRKFLLLQGLTQPLDILKHSLNYTLTQFQQHPDYQSQPLSMELISFLKAYSQETLPHTNVIEYDISPPKVKTKRTFLKFGAKDRVKDNTRPESTGQAAAASLEQSHASENLTPRSVWYDGIMSDKLIEELNQNPKFIDFLLGHTWRSQKLHHDKDKQHKNTAFFRIDLISSDDIAEKRHKGKRTDRRALFLSAGKKIIFIGTATHKQIPELKKPFLQYNTKESFELLFKDKDYDFRKLEVKDNIIVQLD